MSSEDALGQVTITCPCGGDCRFASPIPGDPWSEWVLCNHPFKGGASKMGHECAWYTPASKEGVGSAADDKP